MSQHHKKAFDEYITKSYQKILKDYRYYCYKNYSQINEEDVTDMFNEVYLDVVRNLVSKPDDYQVKYANYFYMALKNRVMEINIKRTKANVSAVEFGDWLHPTEDEPSNDEDPFKLEVCAEILRYINSNFTEREVSTFKFRIFGGMSWPAMAKYSGLCKLTLQRDYTKVATAIHLHFKANKLNQIKVNNGKIDVVSPEGSRGLQSQPSDKVVGDDSSNKPVKKSKAGRKPKSFTNPTDAWGVDGVVEG